MCGFEEYFMHMTYEVYTMIIEGSMVVNFNSSSVALVLLVCMITCLSSEAQREEDEAQQLPYMHRPRRRRRPARRRVWCRTWLARRTLFGQYEHFLHELNREDPANYTNFLLFDADLFGEIIDRVTPAIKKESTSCREPLESGLKLDVTLRHLATGVNYADLMYSFRVARNSMSLFVPEVCEAIISAYKEEVMPDNIPEEDWLRISAEFEIVSNLPRACGALDGKHIRNKKPADSAFEPERHESYEPGENEGPTYFIPQPNNVTFRRGQTAIIQCSIENLGSKYVIWRKASNPHPISIGELIYVPDKRFNVSFSTEHRKYDLIIRNVQPPDAGVYECQVSSVNKIIRHVMLKVTESSSPTTYVMPEIVLNGKEYVNSGETIQLMCNISGASDAPQDLDWFKDGRLLRDTDNTLIHKQSSIAKRTLYSLLEVRHSKHEDSGTYVCRSSDILIESQKVIVLSEEKSNPGKRGTAADAKSGQMCNRQWWTLFATTMMITLINKFMFYLT